MSGDQFINSRRLKRQELRDNFGGDAARDGRSSSSIYFASCASVPCAVLRVISDMADGLTTSRMMNSRKSIKEAICRDNNRAGLN